MCQCLPLAHAEEYQEWPVTFPDKVESPYTLSVADYLAKAEQQQGSEKQHSLLLAAGRLLVEHQWQQSEAILAQTSPVKSEQYDEKNLLLAKIDLFHDKPEGALNKLQMISKVDDWSAYQQIEYHEALAEAYKQSAKAAQSVAERIKLEMLLSDEQAVLKNRQALWLTLINMPHDEIKAMNDNPSLPSELQGWLQLAMISQHYRNDSSALLTALKQWQTQFSMHPANYILPSSLDSIADKLLGAPHKIALLLPLSGPFSGPGHAIYDGFMAAYNANKDISKAQIKLYDTQRGAITALYEQALNEGADYVVGPLTKNQVARVAQMPHPVPTLLLNDTEKVQANSYTFGLSPSNEAAEVAIKASAKGYKRALVFAPDNEWGAEVLQAFRKEWQQHGGRVVDVFSYNVSPQVKEDFNKKIREFLHITNSQTREQQIKELLGLSVQGVPSRRQDFDMIFLLAYPSKARQIMPALKYYYASDVPVYATSSVYSGNANPLKDKDLDGVIFCDIPWVFDHQLAAKNWPEQFNSYNRLYALGKDSYALASRLNQLILFSADGYMKKQDVLYLKPSKQVARALEWGQFKDGLAHSLG